METLTNEEMLEIEGGDWYGIAASLFYAALSVSAQL
jgi:hypothetical protein